MVRGGLPLSTPSRRLHKFFTCGATSPRLSCTMTTVGPGTPNLPRTKKGNEAAASSAGADDLGRDDRGRLGPLLRGR